uniref:Uncharacterized protein n=1 Tax=Eutreptiella gymnastica TaxID=73025 RepID=A0A6T2IP60_9EUGL
MVRGRHGRHYNTVPRVHIVRSGPAQEQAETNCLTWRQIVPDPFHPVKSCVCNTDLHLLLVVPQSSPTHTRTPSGTIFHLRFLKLCECCSGVKSTAEDTSVRLGLWCDERIVCGCGGVFVSV